MEKRLLLKITLAFFPALFAVNVHAQHVVQVACVNSAPLSVPLSQFARISFSSDLEAMQLELSDGTAQQIALSDLGGVSFAPMTDKETASNEFGTEVAPKLSVADNRLTAVSSAEPLRLMALYDATGRLVATAKGNEQTMQLSISTSSLSAGVYIVSVESVSQRMTRKVVIN